MFVSCWVLAKQWSLHLQYWTGPHFFENYGQSRTVNPLMELLSNVIWKLSWYVETAEIIVKNLVTMLFIETPKHGLRVTIDSTSVLHYHVLRY